MPHEIQWLVEKRVILCTFHGTIHAEELEQFIGEVRSAAQTGIPLVHLITDSLDLQKLEISLATLKSLAQAAKMAGELGWIIDINRNPVNRMFAGLAAQFAGVRFRTVLQRELAVNFLKTNDLSLTELEWNVDAQFLTKP